MSLASRLSGLRHLLDRVGGLFFGGVDHSLVPKHVAIIMDGNGRWAERRGLPRLEGHKAGARAIRSVVVACIDLGIPFLTIYTFSSENWRRPEQEVTGLMHLFQETLDREVPSLNQEGVRITVIGDRSGIPEATASAFDRAEEQTRSNERLTLGIALNYGGRAEILGAAKKMAEDVVEGKRDISLVDEQVFASYLYAPHIPDPELVIRTGGEMRLSNFLTWQVAYAELWVTKVLWPEFGRKHLLQAIRSYQGRERRFGGFVAKS